MDNTNSHCGAQFGNYPEKGGILGKTIEEKTRAILGWTGDHQQSAGVLSMGKKRRASHLGCPYDISNTNGKSSPNHRKWSGPNEYCHSLISLDSTPPFSPIITNQIGRSIGPPSTYSPSGASFSPESPLITTNADCSILRSNFEAAEFSTGSVCTDIFDRLRAQMPRVSTEENKFRLLLRTVASVIELETKLGQLHEQTTSLSNIIREKKMKGRWDDGQCRGNYQIRDCSPSSVSNTLEPSACTDDVPADLQEIDVTAFRWLLSQANDNHYGPFIVTVDNG